MSSPRNVRPLRPHLPDVRPLDRFKTLKIKMAIVVAASVTLAAFVTWLGLRYNLGPTRTFPLAIVASMLFTMLLARGMTSPLREMTSAARSMSEGDYSRRVQATSRDEVGQLATAFNIMAEDLDSSDRVRRELIANVSHELRTPVAALHAQLENLVDGVVEPTPATMQTALTQTERLTRLIAYLLDLSRVEAGAADLNLTEVVAKDFLEDVVNSVSTIEAGKQLAFFVDVEPEDATFTADQERLRQILVNLLHNAIRHSPFMGEVSIMARRTDDEIVFDVSDNGPGVAVEDRQRIFERFARGGAGVNGAPTAGGTGSGGTGIGLAIVRWAVDLHGGTVEVADTLAGATMRVALPQRPPGEEPDPSDSDVVGGASSSGADTL
ncbi:HAMP domain-containing sensor histidine kinase [Sanguibacter inulinus]|uniref:HAMP domain-containing sensor histidine kinase n=1 Tax=Sanguibacter inulinus TaxID=60922 RepID=UPI001D168EB7|nr:HAMP domain-containing sensor histidine kinase [Sanguibacter inulinus]